MKWTNKHNFPAALARAIEKDDYDYNNDPSVYSVTEIINAPRITLLRRRHAEEIIEDVSDGIWRLMGSAIHSVLERAQSGDSLQEERLYKEFENGMTLRGKPDLWESPGIITDWKFTSVWSFVLGDKPEWEAQLNCYAELYREAGFPVESLRIIGILRDWSTGRAKAGNGYPRHGTIEKPIPLWDQEKTLGYIIGRLSLIEDCLMLPDDKLPECTPEERWHKPDKWAVMKPGRKSAIKLHDTEAAAVEHAEIEKPFYVEHRIGEDPRCENYCPAAPFCSYWKEHYNKGGE